jgi:hypothetical protein
LLKENKATNMTTQPELRTFYETHLTPKLIELEKQRQQIVGKLMPIWFGYIALMIMVVGSLIILDERKVLLVASVSIFIVTTLIYLWIMHLPTYNISYLFTFFKKVFTLVLMVAYSWFFMLLISAILQAFQETTDWITALLLLIVTLATVGLWIWYFIQVLPNIRMFQTLFKKAIFPQLVTFIDKNLSYGFEKILPVEEFHTSRLFKRKYGRTVDKWVGEYYVEGDLSSIPMIFSEVSAQEKKFRYHSYSYEYVPIFQGLFFVFNFRLNFKGITLVVPYRSKVVDKYVVRKFVKVTLDDPELARHFTIYSENPEIARYVLSTELLRHLLTFSRRFQQQVYLSFVNGKLYVAISVKKFQVPLYLSALNFKRIKAFFEVLRLGKDIVEEFSIYLNQPMPSLSSETKKGDNKTRFENLQILSSLPKNDGISMLPTTNLTPIEQFKRFYSTYLKPKLRLFEKQRKAIVKKKVGFSLIVLWVLLSLPFMFLDYLPQEILEKLPAQIIASWAVIWLVILVLILFGLKVAGYPISRSEKERFQEMEVLPYQTQFKTEIIGSIVAFVDSNLHYDPEKQIPLSEFETSGLWKQNPNQLIGEDYAEGIINQTEVTFSEVHTKHQDIDEKKTVKGLFFVFNFHLNFEGVTVVSSKSFLGNAIHQSLPWQGKEAGLNLVKLADPEFERAFTVHSDNPAMIDSVFSADFRQRLLAFQRRLDKSLLLSFANGKLYMAIATDKDLFEAPIYRTVLNFKLMTEFFEYLYIGREIVKEFNFPAPGDQSPH